MNKTTFTKLFNNNIISKLQTITGLSRSAIYKLKKKYNIPNKSSKWWASIPDDVEAYKKKWQNIKGRSMEFWAKSNERVEEKYMTKKNQIIERENAKLKLLEEIKAQQEVQKCLSR